jgi:hypothetical protein
VTIPLSNHIKLFLTFSVSGKTPELLVPETGKINTTEEYKEEEGKISLKVDLSSFGSLLVVFKDKIEAKEDFPAYENYDKKLNLDKVWAIKFPQGWGASV